MGQERRRRSRVHVEIPVVVVQDGRRVQGILHDVSLKGLSCSVDGPLQAGAECAVTLALASGLRIHVAGRVVRARGHLGGFEVEVEGLAAASPHSRDRFRFEAPAERGTLSCDLILDLSGGTPFFSAHDKRDGYLRVDPRDAVGIERALFELVDLVGEFEKPRYVRYDESVCAHMRSRIIGCTRCLDVCPTGAITSVADKVAFDPYICAGCGSCSGVCPTGAATYASPTPAVLAERLRTLLSTYLRAGGEAPDLLVYEDRHGGELLSLLARFGDGLPARVLPFRLPEIGLAGIELFASAWVWGARRVVLLLPPKKRAELVGLERTLAILQAILDGLGYERGRLRTVTTDDPDELTAVLRDTVAPAPLPVATHAALGTARQLARLAFDHLHAHAPAPADAIPLPAGAPFGTVEVNVDGCTLCLSCVGACPTGALIDNPDRPMLRFDESLCIQCGLCRNTCPEKVIRLEPRLAFGALVAGPRLVKEEEPFNCVRCGKPFGVKSSIDRIISRLAGVHWMFQSEGQIRLLQMCEDCRVIAQFEIEERPFVLGTPRKPRTTEDYLREREEIEAARRRLRESGDGEASA
jgi:ferredoxin